MDSQHNTPDLIPFATRQLGSETVNTVNARDLHAYLGITQRYADWIKVQIRRAHLIENTDYIVFPIDGNNPQGGRPQVDHHLTFDAAKHVAMMSSAEKGHEVRAWFIAKEKELSGLLRPASALDKFPEYRLAVQALEAAAQSRLIAEAAQAEAAQSRLAAARAEGKADMALEEARTMTLEDFVLWNGLLRQLPESRWHEYARWLRDYCLAWGLDNGKSPVLGKVWKKENAYPVTALSALKRYEQTRPQQVTLLRDKKDTK